MVYTEEYIKNKLAKELEAVHVVSIERFTIFIHLDNNLHITHCNDPGTRTEIINGLR